MTSVFASRRRAEEFNSLVESPTPGALADARHEEFLAIVASLRAVTAPEPRPQFVASLREELMSAADTLLVPTDGDRLTLPPRNNRRDRRLAAAVGGLAVVGAGTSMAVAAQTALPGEMLYPLKRVMEDVQVGAATSSDAEARALLDSATARLEELQALGREGELAAQADAASANFVDFGTRADEAARVVLADYAESGDRRLVRELRDFTGDSMSTLQALEPVVPASARDELLAAVELISDIDARAQRACPGCGGEGVSQIPRVLLSSAATDSGAVVIPGATVEAWEPRTGQRRSRPGDRDRTRTSGPLATTPLTGDGGDGSGGGSGTGGALTDLTDTLTGGGDAPKPPGDVDVDVDLDVGGVDVDGTVKDTLEDTEEQLEDTTDQLGDALLGD